MVEHKVAYSRLPSGDESVFPSLFKSGYRVTSPKTPSHNCIAYAAGDLKKKWEPTTIPPIPGYYWPPGARRDNHPDALKSAFETLDYLLCDNAELESGFEKVALYADSSGEWTHASKQNENGEWSSKLGNEEDIVHKSPHCFEGSIYGKVVYFMKRKHKRGDNGKSQAG